MLDANELNQIYDKGVNDPPPDLNPSPARSTPAPAPPSLPSISTPVGSESGTSQYHSADYVGYLNEPLYEAKGDPDVRRGLAQSNWDKVGNFVAQTGVKTITQFTEGLGHLGGLLGEWGDNRDYDNSLVQASRGLNEWVEKNAPLYRHNKDTFAFNDLSWWLENASGLTASVAAFAGEGAIFGALVNASRLAEGIELVANAGKRFNTLTGVLEGRSLAGGVAKLAGMEGADLRLAYNMGQKSAEVVTAGLLAYTEGAMAGKRVYDQVYSYQLKQALNDGKELGEAIDYATHKAAQSAATNTQLNTMVNTTFGFMGGVGEFFNTTKNNVIKTAKENLFMTAEEAALGGKAALEAYNKRFLTETAEKLANKLKTDKSLLTLGREAAAEGMEELTNNWAENTAVAHGKKGEEMGFFNQLKTLGDYFTTEGVLDKNGALNFALGAIAGPIQHGLANNIPMHKVVTGVETKTVDGIEKMVDKNGEVVERYEDAKKKYLKGKFGTNLVTKRTANQFGVTQYFNDIRTKIAEDYKQFADIQTKIKAAMDNDEVIKADELRKELFDVTNLNSVSMGFSENLKETYRSFMNADNTKTAAMEAQEDVVRLQKAVEDAKAANQDTTQLEADLKAASEKTQTGNPFTAAMELGLATSPDDNDYVQKAQKAIEHLDNLERIHQSVKNRVGEKDNDMNTTDAHVSDIIFHKYGNLYLLRERNKELKEQLKKADETVLGNVLGDLQRDADLHVYGRKITRLATAYEDIKARVKRIDEALINEEYDDVKELLAEHGANGVTDEDIPKALKELKTKLVNQGNELWDEYEAVREATVNTPLYERWANQEKNKGKSFDEFLTDVAKEQGDTALQRQLSTEIAANDSKIKTHEEFVNEVFQARTLTGIKKKVAKNLAATIAKMMLDDEETERERTTRLEAEKERRADNIRLMRELQKRYESEMKGIKLQIADLKQHARTLIARIKKSDPKNIELLQELLLEKEELEYQLESLERRVNTLQTLWNEAEDIIQENAKAPGADDVVSKQEEPDLEPDPEEPAPKPSKRKTPVREGERKKVIAKTMSDIVGATVVYKGKIGEVKLEDGKFVIETETQIIELSDVNGATDPSTLGIRVAPKVVHNVTDTTENGAVVNGIYYWVETDEKGNVTGLYNGQNMIRNENMLIAVEIERNRTGFQGALNKPVKRSTWSLDEQATARLLQTIYEINMTDTVADALEKLAENKPLNESEMLQFSLWADDVLARFQTLTDTEGENEMVQNAYEALALSYMQAVESIKKSRKTTRNVKKDRKGDQRADTARPAKKRTTEKPKAERSKKLNKGADAKGEAQQQELEFIDSPEPQAIASEPVENRPPVPTPAMDALIALTESAENPDVITDIFERMVNGEQVSLDALSGQNLGGYTSAQAIKIIHAALKERGDIIGELEDLVFNANLIDTTFEDDTDPEEDDPETPPPPPLTESEPEPTPDEVIESAAEPTMVHDGFVTNNELPKESDHLDAQPREIGMVGNMQRHPANAMAQNSILEKTGVNQKGQMSQSRLDRLDPELHPDIVDPDELKTGTMLTVQIDTNFLGTKDLPPFEFYLDENGMLKTDDESVGEVPIAIKSANGQVAYVHRVKWIQAVTDPRDTSPYRFKNCVPMLTDESGNVIVADNIAKEVARVLAYRRTIVANYNSGNVAGVQEKVLTKGKGTIPFQKNYSSASQRLPGVQLAIVTGNNTFQGTSHENINPVNDNGRWYGRTVAMIPMNDGSFSPVTLQGLKLSETKHALNTMIRVTEILLAPDADGRREEAALIKEATKSSINPEGFDVTTLKGYRNFMIQYFTYFTALDQLGNTKSGVAIHAGKALEGEATPHIAIGRKTLGSVTNKPVVAKMENGRLSRAFQAELAALASERFQTVTLEKRSQGIQGINSTEQFTEVLYNAKTGKWETNTATTYTDAIKRNLFTNVVSNGRMKRSNGKDMEVFAVNPIIRFSMTALTPEKADDELLFPDPDAANQVALNDAKGTNDPVQVPGTKGNVTPLTREDVQKVYDKIYDEVYEEGGNVDALPDVDTMYRAAKDNSWTVEMLESKFRCG